MFKNIIKRDGSIEAFSPSKVNHWGEWAAQSLGDKVDWSSIVLHAVSTLSETATSQELQARLIKSCLDENTWSYNLMAGRLYAPLISKKVFGNTIPTIKELHTRLQEAGLMVTLNFTDEEYSYLNTIIDHTRDHNTPHYSLHQIREKYSLKNRNTGQEYETQQFVFMRMAMALATDQPQHRKMVDCVKWYNHFSMNRINAPTPNYTNLGTPMRGYASCSLYKSDDNAKSLAIGDHIAYTMTYMSAGIGSHINTRSIGDKVRNGFINHQGRLPYYRSLVAAVKANLQNGRGGACTTFFSAFDPEAPTINMLQNPKSTEDKKIRGMDYSFMNNKFFARKVARNENIFTFNSFTAPDLYEAIFSSDKDLFETLYNQYDKDETFKKNYVSARELLIQTMNQAYETGRHYLTWMDEANKHTPFKDPIYSSNLCVSPSTQILTDKGYFIIEDLENEEVNVWNGEKFSKTIVRKTSELSKLIKVYTDSGMWLECTPYHKFYIQQSYNDKDIIEVQASDLKPGMKLIKFDLPVIEGEVEFNKAYENGFYTGDGCKTPQGQRIYLYGEKRKLKHKFPDIEKWYVQEDQDRELAHYKDLYPKYSVPDARFTVKSRLDWLAGLSDSDGCIYRNQGNQQLVISSINKSFLERTSLMLQTLGVCSKVRFMFPEGDRLMPSNDGTGGSKLFSCKESYRLIIPSNELQSLVDLGLTFHRLSVVKHSPQRNARHFVQILDVKDEGRYDRTFCFTEEERHMGMFNGMLTGQCTEIFEPTMAYSDMQDLYSSEDHGRGELAICSLGAIVAANVSDEDYADTMYYCLLMIDKCIHLSEYAFPHLELTAKSRMNAGVGITGLAHYLAKNGFDYTSKESKEEQHRIGERHAYHAISQSLRLGKELGNAPWIHKTKWVDGWTPLETYNRNVDSVVKPIYRYDWEQLSKDIIANKGIRNSCLVAHMPTESSSKASGTSNGLYPVRDLNMLKTDNHTVTYWSAPDSDSLKDNYQIAWNIPSEDLIETYAIFQKFTDQGISADLYRKIVGTDTVTSSEMISQYLYMTKLGLKSRYYQNTLTTDGQSLSTEMVGAVDCVGGACSL